MTTSAKVKIISTPHPCLALSHIISFLKIGKSAVTDRSFEFTIVLSSADVAALDEVGIDVTYVTVLEYPGFYNRSECLDIAARYAELSPLEVALLYVDVGLKSCQSLLSYGPLWDALLDKEFDVFLGEPWPCSSLVADKIDKERARRGKADVKSPPRLLFQGYVAIDPWCEHMGAPSPATEVPQLMGTAHMLLGPDPMPLPHRMLNVVLREVSRLVFNNIVMRPYAELRRTAGVKPENALRAMHSSACLVLIPIVWGVEPPRALPPNWKAIHPVLPSPPNLISDVAIASFIESECVKRSRRIVPVAFGTQSFLSRKEVDKMVSAVASLSSDFCFVWHFPARFGHPTMLSALEHVLPVDWLPQNDILGHSQTAAFVSHVGYGSLYEAAYHGVPLVGVPMFGDQDDNIARAVMGGWGVRLDRKKFTAQELANAIMEAGTEGSAMMLRARAISALVQAKSGTREVLDWIEYAHAHGVSHLVPVRAMKSSFRAYYNADILLLIIAMVAYCSWSCGKKGRRDPVRGRTEEKKFKAE